MPPAASRFAVECTDQSTLCQPRFKVQKFQGLNALSIEIVVTCTRFEKNFPVGDLA
jgi:hypothetical protein